MWLAGVYDAGWAPFTVTAARESCTETCSHPVAGQLAPQTASCCVDFGTPLLASGVAALVSKAALPAQRSTIMTIAQAVLGPRIVNPMLLMIIMTAVVGNFVWLAERKSE